MSEKAIWITVEEPITGDKLEEIRRTIESTELTERYEIILTGDSIDTLDMAELRELIADD